MIHLRKKELLYVHHSESENNTAVKAELSELTMKVELSDSAMKVELSDLFERGVTKLRYENGVIKLRDNSRVITLCYESGVIRLHFCYESEIIDRGKQELVNSKRCVPHTTRHVIRWCHLLLDLDDYLDAGITHC
jgi:hypothetical protein